MKVSFAEMKRHAFEVAKREEELEKFEDEYYKAEMAFERKVDQLRAELLSGPESQKVERGYNRYMLWRKKSKNVREALEKQYPGLRISDNGTLSRGRLTYLGKTEDVAWEDADEWIILTALQSDHGPDYD